MSAEIISTIAEAGALALIAFALWCLHQRLRALETPSSKPDGRRPAIATAVAFPMSSIRRNVFGGTQSAFAQIAGVTQATVSRWERGELEPSREEMARIRSAAHERGIAWDDRWFFEPAPAAAQAVAS
ncbi:MAG TPA: helix-turn-helix domain-containing protein [Xanthobacteraceae bacterium]|nr:helix-turn-helix domain-containing protein [Xanthobacteraceae bacterium]